MSLGTGAEAQDIFVSLRGTKEPLFHGCAIIEAGGKAGRPLDCAPGVRAMFTKDGIAELHGVMHERLDLLLRHIGTMPDNLQHQPIPGFGHPSVFKQMVHILTCEEG